ncbi:hypothetical protein ACTFIU_006741 [Dictyostelium citrinum]
MAERKATNKYYPPDWDPSKGSINQYRGQHHLRDRAKKIDQGILIVRFEMPFGVWCLGCECHIGMGVRFNAEKKTVGKYFTSNIYSFKMKCHQCSNQFEIQTDPKNTDYKLVSGLKKRIELFDPEDSELPSSFIIKNDNDNNNNNNDNSNNDTLIKLENKKLDIEKGKKESTQLERLQELMTNRTVNDYQLSSIMRKSFREKKKEEQIELERQKSKGIMIPLVKEHQDDIDTAKDIDFNFNSLKRKLDESKKIKRELIKNESILKSSNNNNKNNVNNNSNNSKIEAIIRKKSKIDPSLFNNNNNNSNKSKVNETFTSNLFK